MDDRTLRAPSPSRWLRGSSAVRLEVAALRRLAVRGGAYLISSRLIVQLFSWVVTIVAARLLRPYDYGILTAASTFINLADLLAEGGVCKALVQKRASERE